jgi:uncharacterized protein (DUF305 family)
MAFFSRSFLRKRAISLATTMVVAAGPSAFAQDAKPDRTSGKLNEQRFVIESELAVSKVDRGMIGNQSGDVDQDFVAMMIPHHQGAIDIARAELKYGHDEKLKQLAQAIVSEQEQEIRQMRADGLALIHSTAEPAATR